MKMIFSLNPSQAAAIIG